MSAFVKQEDVEQEQFDWGTIGWRCRPANTGSRSLVVMDVTLEPGEGHAFHRHDGQEEVLIVKEGSASSRRPTPRPRAARSTHMRLISGGFCAGSLSAPQPIGSARRRATRKRPVGGRNSSVVGALLNPASKPASKRASISAKYSRM